MPNKKFLLTFSILSLIVWSSSWWAYWVFRWADYPHPYSLRTPIMLAGIVFILLLALVHIVYQVISGIRNRHGSVAKVIILNIICMVWVGFYALLVSMRGENTWGFLFQNSYHFKDLITILLASEGWDIIFVFFLALLSGYIVYSPPDKFNKNEFLKALIAWCLILFINEMVFQRFIFTFRTSSITDVFNNILGGAVPGLSLSIKRFYKK